MKYVIFDKLGQDFLCRQDGKECWKRCYHDSLTDIKWGEDLESLSIFSNKYLAERKIKKIEKHNPLIKDRLVCLPVKFFKAIEIDFSSI